MLGPFFELFMVTRAANISMPSKIIYPHVLLEAYVVSDDDGAPIEALS